MHQAQPEWRSRAGHVSSVTSARASKEPEELLRLFGRIEIEAPLIIQKLVQAFERLRDPENKEARLGSRLNIIQGFFRELLEPSVLKDMTDLKSGPRDRAVQLVETKLNSTRGMLTRLSIEKSDNLEIYALLASLRKANTLAAGSRSGRRTELSNDEWQAKVGAALAETLSVIDAHSDKPISVCRSE